jgi:hypothetical protein
MVAALGLALAALLAGPLPAAAAPAPPDSDRDGLSDAFEIAYGLDPNNKDTDGDGVRDPAEDGDHDHLSNLGEQRAHTSPLLRDTDRDGVPDGREDADRDGIVNAREQDRRRIPVGLTPSLKRAGESVPAYYAEGCHTTGDSAEIHPCAFGDTSSATTIVLFGDSHMGQWAPGFFKAGVDNGWRVVVLTKSACPAASIEAPAWRVTPTCATWRARAIEWLAANPAALIVMSSSRHYTLFDARGRPATSSARRTAWASAMGLTASLMPAGVPAVVLADTTWPGREVPLCLSEHRTDMSRCTTPRSRAIDRATVGAERWATESAGVAYDSLTEKVCPYDPCPVVNGRILIYRDHSHITLKESEALAPSVAAFVRAHLPPPPPPPALRRHARPKG